MSAFRFFRKADISIWFRSGSKSCKLILIQTVIYTFLFQQFFMIAGFHNGTIFHYNDDIGITDCGESVCNDQTGPILHKSYHSLLDMHFSSGIHRRGCFVQNQNFGIGQNRSSDCQELPLTLRLLPPSASTV